MTRKVGHAAAPNNQLPFAADGMNAPPAVIWRAVARYLGLRNEMKSRCRSSNYRTALDHKIGPRQHCHRIEEFDAVSEQSKKPDQDETEASILDFDVDDAAIEIAAAGVGTIPTASVNIIPPNCCVQQPR